MCLALPWLQWVTSRGGRKSLPKGPTDMVLIMCMPLYLWSQQAQVPTLTAISLLLQFLTATSPSLIGMHVVSGSSVAVCCYYSFNATTARTTFDLRSSMHFILSLAEGSVASLYPCNLLCVVLSIMQHHVLYMPLGLQDDSLTSCSFLD